MLLLSACRLPLQKVFVISGPNRRGRILAPAPQVDWMFPQSLGCLDVLKQMGFSGVASALPQVVGCLVACA